MNQRAEQLDALDAEVVRIVHRAKRRIREMTAAVHPDLAPGGYLMLGHIHDHGPVRATSLVEAFDADKAAVSRHIQHLVELGLLARSADPDDGRAYLLSITEEGARRILAVRGRRRAELDASLGEWQSQELEALVAQLRHYNDSMEPQHLAPAAR